MSDQSTKNSSKTSNYLEQNNIMGDFEENLVCGYNLDYLNLDMNIYDSNSLCESQENLIFKVIDQYDDSCQTLTTNDIYFKDRLTAGRSQDSDLQCKDGYASSNHCEIDIKRWFKKRSPWVKEYSYILKIKELPIYLCRQIFEFLREPRRVVIRDCGSFNGTFVSMCRGENQPIFGNEFFRFGDELEMIVEDPGLIALGEDETFGMVDEKILEENNPKGQYIIFHDDYKAEEGCSRKYSYLPVQIRFIRQPDVCWKYILVSNKTSSSFSMGNSLEAKLSNYISKNTDPYQCELVLEDEKWYVKELQHDDRRKKTWIGLFGNYTNEEKLAKNKGVEFAKKPRQKEITIKESRDILVGRIIVEVSFGEKKEEGHL